MKRNLFLHFGMVVFAVLVLAGCQSPDSGDGDDGSNGQMPAGNTLKDKLDWLRANAQSNSEYLITLDRDDALDGVGIIIDGNGNPTTTSNALDFAGKTNITIRLNGNGHIVNLLYSGPLFTINSGVTLILEQVTLQGDAVLVIVRKGGALEMRGGSKITGKTSASGGGGVENAGTFTMNGGIISGNTTSTGGGGVFNFGTFTMNDGEISGNTVTSSSSFGYGGGVYNRDNGIFIMNGGKISGNTVSGTGIGEGGGVYVLMGTFIMNGGEISGNTATSSSGVGGSGGGVYVDNSDGTFTMTGGLISGNTAVSLGGGVHVNSGTFTKQGGTITGYASDAQNGNVVKNNSGVVQSNKGHAVSAGSSKQRETTVGPDVALDSKKSGAAGGWVE